MTTLDPGFDKWVWLAFLGLLIVFGVRAWIVERSRGRLARTPAGVRVLTFASVGMVAVVLGLLWVQGGQQVFNAVVHRTDPITGLPLDQPAAPVADVTAPAADAAVVDPNAPANPAPAGP